VLRFDSRAEAGKQLAARLAGILSPQESVVVLALPRGGVPVAFEIARALGAPLDLLLVRKIGVPWQPELAAAAIVEGERPDVVYNRDVMEALGLGEEALAGSIRREAAEIERRRALYLKGAPPIHVGGKTAIVVDDGIATGATVKAALRGLRRRQPARLILAAPVASPETLDELRPLVDELVVLAAPAQFGAIGAFYRDFHQCSDEEVIGFLRAATAGGGVASATPGEDAAR
jgi:putative phosphoribosyl transferase